MSRAVSKALGYLRSLALQLRAASGPRGWLRVLEVVARGRRSGTHEPVGVPMRRLGGEVLWVRPGTSDLRNASYYYLGDLFKPPVEAAVSAPERLVELGSNMGAALTALAVEFPTAAIVGVEPDGGNAAMARRNVERFGDRVNVVETGVWDADTELIVERGSEHGEHGFTVREAREGDPPGRIEARKLDTILAASMPEGDISYMHVTIEGTEPRLFGSGGDWVRRIRSLKVEAHPALGYPASRCIEQLEALGYRAWPDAEIPEKWVLAVRDREPTDV